MQNEYVQRPWIYVWIQSKLWMLESGINKNQLIVVCGMQRIQRHVNIRAKERNRERGREAEPLDFSIVFDLTIVPIYSASLNGIAHGSTYIDRSM